MNLMTAVTKQRVRGALSVIVKLKSALKLTLVLLSFQSLMACGMMEGEILSTAPLPNIPFRAEGVEVVAGANRNQDSVLNGFEVDSSAGQIVETPMMQTLNGYSVFVGFSGQMISEDDQQ